MMLFRTAVMVWVAMVGGVLAQDTPPRAALIVQGDTSDAAARKGAEDLSEVLFGMGFAVRRLEAPTATALTEAATETGRAGEALVVIGAGFVPPPLTAPATPAEPARLVFPGGEVALADLFAALRAGGAGGSLAVVVDACGSGRGIVPAGIATALPTDTLLALPVAPGAACPAGAEGLVAGALAARIGAPDRDFADLLTDAAGPGRPLWTAGTLAPPMILRRGGSGTALTLADYRMLESLPPPAQAEMIAALRAAGFAVDMGDVAAGGTAAPLPVTGGAVSPVISPVVTAVVSPIRAAAGASPIVVGAEAGLQDIVLIAASSRNPTPLVVPDGELPEPYITLGRPPSLIEAVAPPQFDWQDSAGRATAKAEDPQTYATMVAAGAYDPLEADLPVALQTVLSEMNCYRGGIDGQFGNGSRTALGRYFETASLQGVGQDPSLAVWRQVLAGPVVVCPTPVAVQQPSGGGSNRPRPSGGGGGVAQQPSGGGGGGTPAPSSGGGFQAPTGQF